MNDLCLKDFTCSCGSFPAIGRAGSVRSVKSWSHGMSPFNIRTHFNKRSIPERATKYQRLIESSEIT
jgi:hypothetical protein